MNKKLLPLAVLTAVATGGLSTAQAVNVNPDGLGEVLLYPFYSVEGGNDTYVSVTNTTDQVKAVKVRFIEAMNSQEVLDFNLYLSPNDMWTAAITDDGDGGAELVTQDTSCAPGLNPGGEAFRDFEFSQSDDSVRDRGRTREGYVEIIEMGVLDPADSAIAAQYDGAIHTSEGVPANCDALNQAWDGGVWSTEEDEGIISTDGEGQRLTGGLYGSGTIINPADGTNATYSATALDGWFPDDARSLHTNPGSLSPSLASGREEALIFNNGELVELDFFETEPNAALNAVSAVLMHDSIANDYNTDPLVGAGTDWVMTFPTKRDYVNGADAPHAPFTEAWKTVTSTACEPIDISYWDREEREPGTTGIELSPQPPGDPGEALCYEANVMTFNESNVLYGSDRVRRDLSTDFDAGWLEMSFAESGQKLEDFDGNAIYGLPVIGFAVQNLRNDAVEDGVMANYAGLVNHKGTRDIESADPRGD
ncbi:hypothetical protein [Thioalkalivibrio sp. ALE11]|uniref:hypothetical protein n=1 Tax=Thioalkalivibrio sp. ALE11 TaxID=1265494 RepID=UPI000477A9F3|nr:hypothetical protein [Thioalkalivibrio sp. ALE11]